MRYLLALLVWHALGDSFLIGWCLLVVCMASEPQRKR